MANISKINIDGTNYTFNSTVDMSEFNIKSYTSVSNLGLTPGQVSTSDVFMKMDNGSVALIPVSDVNDNPYPNTYAMIYILRINSARGRAFAYYTRGVSSSPAPDKTMYTGETIGLTGTWI